MTAQHASLQLSPAQFHRMLVGIESTLLVQCAHFSRCLHPASLIPLSPLYPLAELRHIPQAISMSSAASASLTGHPAAKLPNLSSIYHIKPQTYTRSFTQ